MKSSSGVLKIKPTHFLQSGSRGLRFTDTFIINVMYTSNEAFLQGCKVSLSTFLQSINHESLLHSGEK